MKTVNYLFESESARTTPRDLPKVVDLTAWRAEHRAEQDEPEPANAPARYGDRKPARRRKALDWAELAATLAVAAAFLALAARVLLF